MTGSEIYAGASCQGHYQCHWCGAPCDSSWVHDDPPPLPFKRSRPSPARRPANPYICWGCWLFRRKTITIQFLEGGYLDRQCPLNHSWLITLQGAWGIRQESKQKLLEFLTKPKCGFVLSLLQNEKTNLLYLLTANEQCEIQANTSLTFALDNVVLTYTTYELNEALASEDCSGREPGVRLLLDYLGPVPKTEIKKGRGRPPLRTDFEKYAKTVAKSGIEI